MIRLVLVLALVLPATAAAGDLNQTPALWQLDAISSEVAGHPVHAWCEPDEGEWSAISSSAGLAVPPGGFTVIGTPITYIDPLYCLALYRRLVLGQPWTPRSWALFAWALHTVVHEAVHQRGIYDERVTDCEAIPLIAPIASRYFGIVGARLRSLPGFYAYLLGATRDAC